MQQSINLLFPATAAVSKRKKGPDMLVVLTGLIFIFIVVGSYSYLEYQALGLTAQLAKANEEVAELSKPLPGELLRKPFIKERDDMQKAVNSLTETRKLMSEPLDEISGISDPEVTLGSVEVKTQPPLILVSGTAPSHTVVSRFMGNIQQTPDFSNAAIKSSTVVVTDFMRVVNFTIEITPAEGVFK